MFITDTTHVMHCVYNASKMAVLSLKLDYYTTLLYYNNYYSVIVLLLVYTLTYAWYEYSFMRK